MTAAPGTAQGAPPQILAASSTLKVGESEPLTLLVLGTPAAPVAWSVSEPTVCDVSRDGTLTARSPGTGKVIATVGAVSSVVTVVVVPDLAGVWSGQMLFVGGKRIVGTGPYQRPPAAGGYRLRVSQTHNLLTAAHGLDSYSLSMNGTVDADGNIALFGSGPFTAYDPGYLETIDPWRGVLSSPGPSIAGSFSMTSTFVNAFGPQVVREDWQILRLDKAPDLQ